MTDVPQAAPMAAMQNLTETVKILGPPFTVEGVRAALARGKFRGLGRKWGGQWFTTEDDRAAMLDRLRVAPAEEPPAPKTIPTVGASGASARSPRYRDRRPAEQAAENEAAAAARDAAPTVPSMGASGISARSHLFRDQK